MKYATQYIFGAEGIDQSLIPVLALTKLKRSMNMPADLKHVVKNIIYIIIVYYDNSSLSVSTVLATIALGTAIHSHGNPTVHAREILRFPATDPTAPLWRATYAVPQVQQASFGTPNKLQQKTTTARPNMDEPASLYASVCCHTNR